MKKTPQALLGQVLTGGELGYGKDISSLFKVSYPSYH